MADLELFWDPVCPFAWITSRWVVEVAGQRPLDVRWRPISLRLLNEGSYDDEVLAAKQQGHELGLELLRVAAAVEAEHGNESAGRLYTELGSAIFVTSDRESILAEGSAALAERALAGSGLPTGLSEAAGDPGWDGFLRESTDTALERTGGDVGTPVITFQPPDGPSFFGPVISRVPRGPEAVELWDAVEKLAGHRWFAELKRSLREPPQVDS